MKIFKWISDNILFLITLFLLSFIPLYPKLPLLNVNHVWVYVRIEDFIVTISLLIWLGLLILRKITFKTPLTLPILFFWIIGAVATIHGVLLIFSTLPTVFPTVALLSYLRRIEYISLFFIAYAGIRSKRAIPYIVFVLAVTLTLVSFYGIGQKYLGFPAFLTMNEEFAKGIPIKLSALSRVSSTFGGHYDLAAYLVLMIPLLTSMIFGFRNYFMKFFLFIAVALGFVVLFMTVSRVSFIVLLVSMFVMLAFYKKRLALYAILALALLTPLFLSFSSTLLQRFGNTVKEVDVLVDVKSGDAIGHVIYVPATDFKDKTIKIKYAQNKGELDAAIGQSKEKQNSSSSALLTVPFSHLPPSVPLLVEQNPTGEDLPQGTGYVNLTLAPIVKKTGDFLYQDKKHSSQSLEVFDIQGDFVIKRVLAYDVSFTTRFQGEWPHAISLFEKNILFGSGYSSTGLAVDNNYLRILGEVGLLGFFGFFGILLIAAVYAKKVLPEVDSPFVKSFVFGLAAGSLGLLLNAIFIDVFEASKVAFTFWLLIGILLGTLHFYQKEEVNILKELKKTLTSKYAIIIYLFTIVVVGFSTITKYYFVGDDFTWLRWVADCSNNGLGKCPSFFSRAVGYFTQSDGFFYRPGTKLYFSLVYSGFWLNQTIYHAVSIFLHFIVAVLLFFIANKILKNFLLSCGASFLFVILSGYSEALFWISSTGFLFNAVFILLALFLFILWKERKKNIYFIFSLVSLGLSLLFHELGVVAPLFLVLYDFVFEEERLSLKTISKKFYLAISFIPLFPYFLLRFFAQSHWFNGDYSYNLFKLPYNLTGNAIGYSMLDFLGPQSLRFYQILRNLSKSHVLFAALFSLIFFFLVYVLFTKVIRKMEKREQRIVIFGILFFLISLLPFLGLGNITSRYSYLSSIGFIFLFVFFLKKVYDRLKITDRNIALTVMVLIVSVFSLVHIIQLEKISSDWNSAGEESKRFLVSLNKLYTDPWTKQPMDFYFVNTPIRVGDAWLFPVGLKDAVWFVFQNKNIRVYTFQSTPEALNLVQDPSVQKVFEFDDSGQLEEKIKPGQIIIR